MPRFAGLHEEIRQRVPEASSSDARAALATVIVLDQFPRNIFRDTAQAFATDAMALTLAANAVARGLDYQLGSDAAGLVQRQFLYMPFMHSEDRTVQIRSLELFAHIGGENLRFAQQHQEIIARFGRFPHRNAILGRTSTAEELEFLKTHPGF